MAQSRAPQGHESCPHCQAALIAQPAPDAPRFAPATLAAIAIIPDMPAYLDADPQLSVGSLRLQERPPPQLTDLFHARCLLLV